MARYVAVIGPSRPGPGVAAAAREVGRRLAEGGAIVVCGGGGGAMEAACEGAAGAGGLTVGILPGPTRADANRFVTVALPTAMGEARNALVVRAADAVVAVGGGVGTLSEIGLALKMGKPVVGLGTWTIEAPLSDRVSGRASGGASDLASIVKVDTPEEAVRIALELTARPGRTS